MSADGLQWTRGDVKVITASKRGGNGGLCLHNMRMRCNKSSGRMVNSAASRCVYARRQVFVWDTRIPAAEPLADPPRTTVTSPNMVHMQA